MAHRARFPELARERPFDAEVRAAAAVLFERLKALSPRITAGGGGGDLACEVEQLLRDQEVLRDQRCAPGSSDWEDLQSRCSQLMVNLARIATGRGRPGEARDWFTRAAAAWQELGDQGWAEECLLGVAEASLADGTDADAVLETLDSWIGERPPPVRRAKLLARTARILLDTGDHPGARQRADEAAGVLDAAGFTDPVTAGSVEDAFATWICTGHREITPALPWLQTEALFTTVAWIWETLIEIRFPLGTLPRPQVLRLVEEVHVLTRRLISEASAVGRQANKAAADKLGPQPTPAFVMDSNAPAEVPDRSYHQVIEHQLRLNVLHDEAQQASPGSAEMDSLLARIAALESEATQAGDALTAALAAIERASTLSRADRIEEAAAALEVARNRLGDGDGLDTARRRALLVTILRRAAIAAGLLKQFSRLSQLCGDAITEFEQDRNQVNEPYLQDSYLRDRVMLYQLGVFAAWKLGDHQLALIRADLAKARGSLGWITQTHTPADAPQPSEIAALRSKWPQLACRQDDSDVAARRAVWTRLMTAQARVSHAVPPGLQLGTLQAALAPDEAIIYYYFVDSQTLLIFTITPTAVDAERRILNQIRGQLNQLADDIAALDGEMDWLDQDIPRLGAHLLPRDHAHLLDRARRLLICPHRILHHLPFHAMSWEHAPLIQRFAVSYVPNITSLLLARPAPPSPDVLSVGIGSYPPPLADLPGAEQEANDIVAIYQRAGAEATVLLDADATRARLEQLQADGHLERFAVIHLVTHGQDHPDDEPYAAALHLADGPVDAMDISQWTLNADLVVLSACWSGRRPAHVRSLQAALPDSRTSAEREELYGDEIYGLQAAFFAAGARQIIGSLWPLDDMSGPAVMSAFHASLSASNAPELALQAAINQQRQAGCSIYHWAPYKLIILGRPAAPHQLPASRRRNGRTGTSQASVPHRITRDRCGIASTQDGADRRGDNGRNPPPAPSPCHRRPVCGYDPRPHNGHHKNGRHCDRSPRRDHPQCEEDRRRKRTHPHLHRTQAQKARY